MTLVREPGLVLWRQISQQLALEIRQGLYPVGSQMPTEADLAARFAVNRHTLRRAIAELQHQGVLRVEQGRGTFVQPQLLDYHIGQRTRFRENVLQQSRMPSSRLLRHSKLPADERLARKLGLALGQPVIMLETLGLANDWPLSVAQHYFCARRFAHLVTDYQQSQSVTEALRLAGVDSYQRQSTRISAQLPDGHQQHHLQIAANQPLLFSEAINIDDQGGVVEFGLTWMVASRVQLVVENS